MFGNEFLQSQESNIKLQDLIGYTIKHQDHRQIPILRDYIWEFLTNIPLENKETYQSRHFEHFYFEMCNYIDEFFDLTVKISPECFEIEFEPVHSIRECTTISNEVQNRNDRFNCISRIYVEVPKNPIGCEIKHRVIEFLSIFAREKIIFSIPHNFVEESNISFEYLQIGANIDYFVSNLPNGYTLKYSNIEYLFDSSGQIVGSNYLDRLSICFHSTIFSSYDIRPKIAAMLPKFKDLLELTGQNEKKTNLLDKIRHIYEYIFEILQNIDKLVNPELAQITKGLLRFYSNSNLVLQSHGRKDFSVNNYIFLPFIFPRYKSINLSFDTNTDHFLILTVNYLILTVVRKDQIEQSIEKLLTYNYDGNFDGKEPQI